MSLLSLRAEAVITGHLVLHWKRRGAAAVAITAKREAGSTGRDEDHRGTRR